MDESTIACLEQRRANKALSTTLDEGADSFQRSFKGF